MDPNFKGIIEKQKKIRNSKVDYKNNNINNNNLNEINKCSDNVEKETQTNKIKIEEEDKEEGGCC